MAYSLTLLGLGALAISLLVLHIRSLLRKQPLPGIPYNEQATSRLLGDVVDIKAAKYRRPWIWNQPRNHGSPISQLFLHPYEKPSVVVSDYREIVDICSRRLKEFDRGTRNRECVGLVAPNFHFTMESRDPRFKVHKELIRDLMTPTFLHQVSGPRVYERASSLIHLWSLKHDLGRGYAFEAGHDIYLATLDIICSVSFGVDEGKASLQHEISHLSAPGMAGYVNPDGSVTFPPSPADPEIEALFDLAEMIAVAQRSPFPYLSQHLAILKPKHARAWWYRRRLVRRQIASSVKKLSECGERSCENALDQLLWREMNAAKRLDREPDFYSSDIQDELMGFLLGGHDTTATVLSWWMKHISRHQQVQDRLRKELFQAHKVAHEQGRWPTLDEIVSTPIPYLDAVMEETLRHAAVATLIIRKTLCDTEILGRPVPKDVNIILTLTGPSLKEPAIDIPEYLRTPGCQKDKDRVPAWGDDVAEYKPERWLAVKTDESGTSREVFCPNAGPNLAFSSGPRQCFGKRLAYLEMRTVMTLLLWNFVIEGLSGELDGDDLIERLVTLPKDCYAKLRRV